MVSPDTHDISRNGFMLTGDLARKGYDWWWHSFTARHALTGKPKSFFIEFFCCNPELEQGWEQPAFGAYHDLPKDVPAPEGEQGRPSYLMVKAGCWGADAKQLHRFFAWKDVEVGSDVPYFVSADDCLSCETDLIGRVEVSAEEAAKHPEWMSDAGSMLWDLHLEKRIPFNVGYGASEPLRDAQLFEMYWHVEGMKTFVSGTVVLDGQTYVVDGPTSYGYADKNWGSDFTSPWLWLSSCNLMSQMTGRVLENSAFDIGGGRPVVGRVALPRKLLGSMVYEGRPYEFNFSKPWTLSKTSFSCQETDDELVWDVRQETRSAILHTEVTCPKDEMLLVRYEAPDGTMRHKRLWNGGTGTGRVRLYEKHRFSDGSLLMVDDMLARNVGCEYGEYE